MKKRTLLATLAVLAALTGLVGYKLYSLKKMAAMMAAMQPPPATVSATQVVSGTWKEGLSAVGTLSSLRGITLKSELAGQIREVAVASGARVKEGDLLVRLDTSVEEAQLAGLRAQERLAELSLQRAKALRGSGTNTENDLDVASASHEQARAAVVQVEATIAKKRIVAPFSGEVGIVTVYEGQFLGAGDPLFALEQIDQLHVDFSLPQNDLGFVTRGGRLIVTLDAYPSKTYEAVIAAVSPRVSDATRSLDVRADLDNQAGDLRPGMYAKIDVVLPSREHALVIPGAAVTFNPYGETVYVIHDGVANQRFIKTGGARGDLVLVTEGLKEGEVVVTSGQIKLRNGTRVQIDNRAAPSAEAAPKPVQS